MKTRRQVLTMGAAGAALVAVEQLVPSAVAAAEPQPYDRPISRSFSGVVTAASEGRIDVREAVRGELAELAGLLADGRVQPLPRLDSISVAHFPSGVAPRVDDVVLVTDYFDGEEEFLAVPLVRWESGAVEVDREGRYVIDKQVAAPLARRDEEFPEQLEEASRDGDWMAVAFLETRLATAQVLGARPTTKPKQFLPWQ